MEIESLFFFSSGTLPDTTLLNKELKDLVGGTILSPFFI